MKETSIHQTDPFIVPTADGKLIEEHFGAASTGGDAVSVAHMIAPAGWSEPAQIPDFDEYSLMIRGKTRVELPSGEVVLTAGESLFVPRGTRVRYANPFSEEAEYWSVCIPAFTPDRAHRVDD